MEGTSYLMGEPFALANAKLGLLTTASRMPYSTASSALMKKSRSVSIVICSMDLPVNSARYPFRVSLWCRISFAWISISARHQPLLGNPEQLE